MNVTFLKQGELYMKSKTQKILSATYKLYSGAKELILPECLKRHLQSAENLVLNFLKKEL
jgi:hypothetical protein